MIDSKTAIELISYVECDEYGTISGLSTWYKDIDKDFNDSIIFAINCIETVDKIEAKLIEEIRKKSQESTKELSQIDKAYILGLGHALSIIKDIKENSVE